MLAHLTTWRMAQPMPCRESMVSTLSEKDLFCALISAKVGYYRGTFTYQGVLARQIGAGDLRRCGHYDCEILMVRI